LKVRKVADIKVSDDELMTGFLEVFRKRGYEGASLEELASASGLKKSSLYHRFPGGKKQMAEEVLRFTSGWVATNITCILKGAGDPRQRLTLALININEFYEGGKRACVLRSLSMSTGLNLFSQPISSAFENLIVGFTKLAEDFGHTPKNATKLAEDTVIRIQGGLIVSKGTGNLKIFKRTLTDIEKSLISVQKTR
jgi:AcrR family transcriptional regulator